MWDGELTTRVKDRKLNEILTFAAMVKVDPQHKDDYIDIIDALSLDIDACDSLLETEGEVEIVLDSISDDAYLSRLSPAEAADEAAFNAYKIRPEDDEQVEPDEDIEDYVRSLIREAVDSIKSEGAADSEGIQALKDELRICRERIEQLSNELEYARSESSQFEDQSNDYREQAERMMEEVERLRKELEASMTPETKQAINDLGGTVAGVASQFKDVVEKVMGDLSIDFMSEMKNRAGLTDEKTEGEQTPETLEEDFQGKADDPVSTEAAEEPVEPVEENVTEEVQSEEAEAQGTCDHIAAEDAGDETAVDCAAAEPVSVTESNCDAETPSQPNSEEDGQEEQAAEEKPIVDRILTDAELETLVKVKAMKTAKIDEFIDKSLDETMNVNTCDDIVTFLKVDIGICDALLEMDYTDIESIVNGFKEILDILEEAPDPRSQNVYVKSLTDEERVLEAGYNNIVEHVQEVMLDRYTHLL